MGNVRKTEVKGQMSQVSKTVSSLRSAPRPIFSAFPPWLNPISDVRLLISGLCALLLALFLSGTMFLPLGSAAQAQQQGKKPEIGWLTVSSAFSSYEQFVRELRKLGYVEKENVTFKYLSAEGNLQRLSALADELVRRNVAVIVTRGTPEALALKKVTTKIPIVFYSVTDPIGSGLVDSLARPGSNVTGFSAIEAVLAGKRLELLKEVVPKLSRIAVLWNPHDPSSAQQWKETQRSARELALQLHSMEVGSAERYEGAFKQAVNAGSGALAVIAGSLEDENAKRIADLAIKNRFATVYPREAFLAGGGLMSYGADRNQPISRVALMVDKILKGAKPADLPVEQPTKFELVVNLKTAKQIGLTIPPNVLARADKVIK
jgi:putative ABC transport system substrate-binding protein